MSILSKAKAYYDMGGITLSAIELVRDITKGKKGAGMAAPDIVDLVGKIVERVIAGFAGTESTKDIQAWIAKVDADLSTKEKQGDEAVDDYFDSKFPKGES